VIDEVVSRGIRTAIIVVFMFGFFTLEEPRHEGNRPEKYAIGYEICSCGAGTDV
jgi:hypothetical protein